MSDDKGITSDDLARISACLEIVGYTLALLALEKTSSDKKSDANTMKKESIRMALNQLYEKLS
ncbi:hypothetical protein [Paenibacillus nasutitermitis]|uniref:Uncharacterized protein n=1 Tax=Paenibacillus nasutitermitis TaxID=1652958 RepID=A0A916YM22_9BACL|nr:hypothetical protein [Paenibacillus nasutitermitis]GGD51014.1 hypothetical protein GCM10010911_05700 [Paenibacillus nasutitermitis]